MFVTKELFAARQNLVAAQRALEKAKQQALMAEVAQDHAAKEAAEASTRIRKGGRVSRSQAVAQATEALVRATANAEAAKDAVSVACDKLTEATKALDEATAAAQKVVAA